VSESGKHRNATEEPLGKQRRKDQNTQKSKKEHIRKAAIKQQLTP
jgi:hypothetical protein